MRPGSFEGIIKKNLDTTVPQAWLKTLKCAGAVAASPANSATFLLPQPPLLHHSCLHPPPTIRRAFSGSVISVSKKPVQDFRRRSVIPRCVAGSLQARSPSQRQAGPRVRPRRSARGGGGTTPGAVPAPANLSLQHAGGQPASHPPLFALHQAAGQRAPQHVAVRVLVAPSCLLVGACAKRTRFWCAVYPCVVRKCVRRHFEGRDHSQKLNAFMQHNQSNMQRWNLIILREA